MILKVEVGQNINRCNIGHQKDTRQDVHTSRNSELELNLKYSVPDSLAKQIIDDLLGSLSTGSVSDGKIFVKDVAEAYDIGSKQTGDDALGM